MTNRAAPLNALRNGSRRRRLILGNLPKSMRRITQNCSAYRRAIEDEVLARRGEISVTGAHEIDRCVGWLQHEAICRWTLNHKFDQLAPNDILSLSREMAHARDRRNKALEKLKLDPEGEQANTLTALYYRDESDHDSPTAANETDGAEHDRTRSD